MAPLRELLKKEAEWSWNTEHDAALEKIMLLLTSTPVLKPFDLRKSAHIQADASQNGLGACLIQEGRVVTYASRAMTTTEQRYAQIEKELLAICYACERFRQYILGNSTIVESDHKPGWLEVAHLVSCEPNWIQSEWFFFFFLSLSAGFRFDKERCTCEKDILNLSFPVRKAGGSDFKTVHLLTPFFFFSFFSFVFNDFSLTTLRTHYHLPYPGHVVALHV